MRIASFRTRRSTTWGLVEGDRLLPRAEDAPATVVELLETSEPTTWLRTHKGTAAAAAVTDVTFAAPVMPRGDVIALGLNYRTHVDETSGAMQQSVPRQPILFSKASGSIVGPEDEIRFDRTVTQQVDWEVELAIVIGRPGRDIVGRDALEHVFGYTVANDVSARDLQFLDGGQWYRGKSLDTFCPLGPWIVTRDELGDAKGLRIALRVNGATKQSASTDDLIFGIEEIVASASAGRTLRAGDVILTGTPGGVGFTRKPPEFLKDGDVVEAEVEGIGVLRNQVRETRGATGARPAG